MSGLRWRISRRKMWKLRRIYFRWKQTLKGVKCWAELERAELSKPWRWREMFAKFREALKSKVWWIARTFRFKPSSINFSTMNFTSDSRKTFRRLEVPSRSAKHKMLPKTESAKEQKRERNGEKNGLGEFNEVVQCSSSVLDGFTSRKLNKRCYWTITNLLSLDLGRLATILQISN